MSEAAQLTDQDAIDAALDAVEKEHGIVHDDHVEVLPNDPEPIETENLDPDPAPENNADDNPPGYKTYDEWIAEGRDPDLYKGKKAYEAEYERIQENKGLKDDIASLKDSMRVITETNQEILSHRTDEIRAQLTAELNEAKETGDVDAALDAQEKLKDLDNKPAQQQQAPQENPLIQQFRKDNPLIDKTSTRFDADYTEDLQTIYNNTVDRVARRDPETGMMQPLSDQQIARILKMAKTEANKLHPHLFKSQRNTRQTTPANNGKKASSSRQSTDYRGRLKDLGGNARNSNDPHPALDMYDSLVERGETKAAEDFAKAQLGE